MRRIFALAAGLLLVVLATAPVLADSTTWKVSIFNASGAHLSVQVANVAADGSVSFTFPATPDAAYLTTAKSGTGDLTGGTISATVGISAAGGTTFENYNDYCGTQIPTVGLYFQTSSTGGFNPSAYWWSTTRVPVTDLVDSTMPLSTVLSGANWSNYYGQAGDSNSSYTEGGTTYPAPAPYFTAAVANITSWGVSFGGGCHYASGVGTPTGSATFTLLP